MRVRLAKKIMKQSHYKVGNRFNYWNYKWLCWNLKTYNITDNTICHGKYYIPRSIEHRITKAISLTSKKRKYGNTK